MNDKIYIYNHKSGEEIVRELTNEEQAQRNADVAAYLVEKEAKEQAETEAKALKISAYQKLGLTEAEIEALLPTPKPKPE